MTIAAAPGEAADVPGENSRSCWRLRRNPASLASFRSVAGIAFAVHFAQVGRTLFAAQGEAALGTLLGRCALSGIALGVALALRASPRVCAALLYALSVHISHRANAAGGLDTYLVNVTSLFLALGGDGQKKSRLNGSVSGVAMAVFLTHTVFVYLTNGFGQFGHLPSPWLDTVRRLLPVAFVVPLPGAGALGAAFQLGLHGYLMVTTRALSSNLLLAGTALLFWGEPQPHPAAKAAPLFDAGAVLALVVATVWLVGAAAPHLELWASPPAFAHVLAELGLLPP